MEITFPIFYVDEGGWIHAFDAEVQLSGHLEFNDIHGEDYRCWDAMGAPVKLGWDGRGVVVGQVGTVTENEALMGALKRYAALERVGQVGATTVEGARGSVALWEAIEMAKKEKRRRWWKWGS